MDLLRTYLRAQALEVLLAREAASRLPGADGEPRRLESRPLIPALPAAGALRFGSHAEGDLFSIRVGSPAAALAFGATPEVLLRQVLARDTAPAQGRDPGGFPTDWDRGWVGPVPLPGALMEVMTGIAMALRLKEEPRVALLVDDTAGSGSGDWHEGLNLAVVRKAPLVVVNHDRRSGTLDAGMATMADRAEAYGFRVWSVEDSDPWGVLEACRQAVAAARSGEGVQVVDVRSGSDAGPDHLISKLREEGMDDATLAALQEEARREMAGALERVAEEPEPGLEALAAPTPPTELLDLPTVRTPRPWS